QIQYYRQTLYKPTPSSNLFFSHTHTHNITESMGRLKYNSSASFLVILIFILLSLCLTAVMARSPRKMTRTSRLSANVSIPALLIFGDSIMDTGMNNNLATVVKCNFVPYGSDFQGGIPSGRFCDGKVPSDIIAEALGIKEIVPAYLDPALKPTDLPTGVSFASGGAGYDPLTSKLAQLEYLKEYIAKLKLVVGENRTSYILSNSLFLVVAGSDDIANTYFLLHARHLYDLPSYTDLMSNSASDFVQELYKLGARKIGVFNAPPIGCVPSQRTLAGGDDRKCAEDRNEAALMFNSKLEPKLKSLGQALPRSKIVYIDVYTPLLQLIQNPRKFGFEDSEKGCCGTGVIEVAVLCNKLIPVTCANVSSHVFWDSFHPTESTYRFLVAQLLDKYMGDLS
ncbi:GDSL esterase/lipase EXL3, partial [Linum perenne]